MRSHAGRLGLLIVLASLTAGVISDRSVGQVDRGLTAAGDKRIAAALAEREFAAVRLPRGAAPVTARPGRARHLRVTPPGAPDLESLLDVHRSWSVPGGPASVIAFMTAHRPAGTVVNGAGAGSGPNGSSQSVLLTLRHLPPGVFAEGLTISAASHTGHKSTLRVDSWAAWLLPRPASEQVPAGVGAITVLGDLGPRTYPVATVTAPSQIAAIVGIVNSRQRVQPGVTSCPFAPSLRIDLRFRVAPGTPVLARAVEDGCYGLEFGLGGRAQPELTEGIDLAGWLWSRQILPRCARASMSAFAELPHQDGAITDREVTIEFRNRSSAVCGVEGFPVVTAQPPMSFHDLRSPPPGVVPLGPGQSAQVALSWTDPIQLCTGPSTAQLQISLPPSTVPFDVPVGSAHHPFRPYGAAVGVSPFTFGMQASSS